VRCGKLADINKIKFVFILKILNEKILSFKFADTFSITANIKFNTVLVFFAIGMDAEIVRLAFWRTLRANSPA
jgi:hypothetical protein